MRYVLVPVFFAALYLLLRPIVSPDPAERTAQPLSRSEQAAQTADGAAEQKRASEPPTRAETIPVMTTTPVATAPVAQPPAGPLSLPDTMPTAAVDKAVDKMGEQRTSTRASPAEDVTGENIPRLVQNELVRLACLADDPDGRWGRKSRKALRRFADRAKSKNGGDPDAELLRVLRSYPANYCKLCKRGQGECAVEAAGSSAPTPQVAASSQPAASPSLSASTPAPREPGEAPSYLPPWMQGEKVARAAEEEASSDALPTDGSASETKPAPRRRSWTSVARPRYEAVPQRLRGAWPSLNGWPEGR